METVRCSNERIAMRKEAGKAGKAGKEAINNAEKNSTRKKIEEGTGKCLREEKVFSFESNYCGWVLYAYVLCANTL